MYVFYNPKEASSTGQQYPEITHEMAQEEIAANSGFDMNTENKSRGKNYWSMEFSFFKRPTQFFFKFLA